MSVPAGLLKMRFKTFFIASTLGTLGWTALLASAGYKLRENYGEIDALGRLASNAVLIVLADGYLVAALDSPPPEPGRLIVQARGCAWR